jgi:hypothetical protein
MSSVPFFRERSFILLWETRVQSSSILVSVRRIFPPLVLLFTLTAPAPAFQEAQADSVAKKQDAFFAGNVLEFTSEKVTISRVVLGKTQKRAFRITPDTKVEGELRMKVRVTVRYETADDGDVALQIIVRAAQQPKQK